VADWIVRSGGRRAAVPSSALESQFDDLVKERIDQVLLHGQQPDDAV
jgi:hypothetical protein